MLPRASVLKYLRPLSGIYNQTGEQADVQYSSVDATLDILKRFERIIIAYPTTSDETERVFQILTALKRIKPSVKVYGHTSKPSGNVLAFWSLQEANWHTTFGTLLDGIYIENFDAKDVADIGAGNGTFNRADQNLAVIGCHNHGYAIYAETRYPETVLGPMTADEESTLIGTDPEIEDGIDVQYYMSNVEERQRSKSARLGTLDYIKGFKEQDDINLFATLAFNSITGQIPDVETFIPIDRWETIAEESARYGMNGFGVDVDNIITDYRWFYTNRNNFLNHFDPRASNDIIGEVENPAFTYALLYGYAMPTAYGDNTAPLYLAYERDEIVVGDNPFFDRIGEMTVEVDEYGYWEVLLAAGPGGTDYTLELSRDPRFIQSVVKVEATLTAETSTNFKDLV